MYQVGRVPRPAVLFGFAPFDEPAAREAVARLRHYLPTT
jgi:hypothetical protein